MRKGIRGPSRVYRLKGKGVISKVKCPRCETIYEDVFPVKPLIMPRIFCDVCKKYVDVSNDGNEALLFSAGRGRDSRKRGENK